MAQNPVAFILVPGAFCLPGSYELVASRLRALGHTVELIYLPTVGRKEGTPPDAYDDANHVRSIARTHIATGHDVVLVGNSYGGFIITEAAKDLPTNAQGSGNLIHLTYLASLLPGENTNVSEMVEGKQPMPTTSPDAYLDPLPAEVAGPLLCSEASPEKQLKYGAMNGPHSMVSFQTRLTHQGWKYVPTTYVVAGRDVVLDPKWQHESADEAIREGAVNVKKVVLETADHFMMVSHKDEVVKILVEDAGRR